MLLELPRSNDLETSTMRIPGDNVLQVGIVEDGVHFDGECGDLARCCQEGYRIGIHFAAAVGVVEVGGGFKDWREKVHGRPGGLSAWLRPLLGVVGARLFARLRGSC